MADTSHVLTIKLQFEDMTTRDKAKMDKATSEAADTVQDGFARAANAAGDDMMDMMDTWQEAVEGFSWAHPIQSFKRLWEGAIDRIEKRWGKLASTILVGIAAIAGNLLRHIVQQIKGLVDAQDMVVKMWAQLEDQGDKFGKRVGQSLSDITGVALQTGDAITDIASTYTTLGKMRVPVENLKELTLWAHQGAYALGANRDELTQFLGLLKVTGGLSEEQLGPHGMLGEMLKVQAAMGLTENEISGMMQGVSQVAQRMKAFGASTKDILAMGAATAKLTGLFGRLGLEAGRGSEMMEKLFDPDRIGENALQIRMMGFSMKEYMDMLAGGAVDQDKLTNGLVRAASQIQDMQKAGVNAFAINQRAQLMGFKNAQEALRIAQEGTGLLGKQASAQADLQKQASEGMSSLKNAFQSVGNMFGAVLAKPLSRFLGLVTKLLQHVGSWIQSHGAAIDKFFSSIEAKIDAWAESGGIERLIEGFKAFGKILGNLIKALPTLLKVIGPLAIVFGVGGILVKGFKAISPLLGGFSKVFGGLTGKLKDMLKLNPKEALGNVGKGVSSLGKSLQGFLKMALVGVAMLLVAGALYVLALAVEKFSKLDWGAMLKAGVALLALSLIMLGIGLLFTSSPVGWAAVAGMLALGAAILMLAGAVWIIADAIGKLNIDQLAGLATLGTLENIKGLTLLGVAIAGMVAPMMLLGPLAAVKFVLVTKGLKDLAIAMYILSKAPDLKTLKENLQGLKTVLVEFAKANLRGISSDVGVGFKELTAGISDLTKMDTSKFRTMGPDMEALTKGLELWLTTMKKGSGFKFLGIGKDIEGLTKGFKDMAIGVYILGAASDKMPQIIENMGKMAGPLGNLMKALSESAYVGVGGGTADMLTALGNAMQGFGNLPTIIGPMERLPAIVTALAGAMNAFGEAGRGVDKFTDFIKKMGEAKQVSLTFTAPTEVPVTGKLEGVQGDLTQNITASFAQSTDNVVQAINELRAQLLEIQGASVTQLINIAKYTKSMSRG